MFNFTACSNAYEASEVYREALKAKENGVLVAQFNDNSNNPIDMTIDKAIEILEELEIEGWMDYKSICEEFVG